MAEKVINIGGRFHDTSSKHTVTGANEILDDDLQKKQSVINAEQVEINQDLDHRTKMAHIRIDAEEKTRANVDNQLNAEINAKQLEIGAVETDLEPILESPNMLPSGAVAFNLGWYRGNDNPEWVYVITDGARRILAGIRFDGSIEWMVGVPTPVKNYVENHVQELIALIDTKVDKEEGKSLIDAEYAEGVSHIDNPEFINVVLDGDGNILVALKTDGTVFYGAGIPPQIKQYIDSLVSDIDKKAIGYYTDNPEWLYVIIDNDERVLGGYRADGKFEYYDGIPLPIRDYVETLLKGFVKKEDGKGLINKDFADGISYTENPEFVDFETDNEGKVLAGRREDGTKIEKIGVETPVVKTSKLDLSKEGKELLRGSLYIDNAVDVADGNLRAFGSYKSELEASPLVDNSMVCYVGHHTVDKIIKPNKETKAIVGIDHDDIRQSDYIGNRKIYNKYGYNSNFNFILKPFETEKQMSQMQDNIGKMIKDGNTIGLHAIMNASYWYCNRIFDVKPDGGSLFAPAISDIQGGNPDHTGTNAFGNTITSTTKLNEVGYESTVLVVDATQQNINEQNAIYTHYGNNDVISGLDLEGNSVNKTRTGWLEYWYNNLIDSSLGYSSNADTIAGKYAEDYEVPSGASASSYYPDATHMKNGKIVFFDDTSNPHYSDSSYQKVGRFKKGLFKGCASCCNYEVIDRCIEVAAAFVRHYFGFDSFVHYGYHGVKYFSGMSTYNNVRYMDAAHIFPYTVRGELYSTRLGAFVSPSDILLSKGIKSLSDRGMTCISDNLLYMGCRDRLPLYHNGRTYENYLNYLGISGTDGSGTVSYEDFMTFMDGVDNWLQFMWDNGGKTLTRNGKTFKVFTFLRNALSYINSCIGTGLVPTFTWDTIHANPSESIAVELLLRYCYLNDIKLVPIERAREIAQSKAVNFLKDNYFPNPSFEQSILRAIGNVRMAVPDGWGLEYNVGNPTISVDNTTHSLDIETASSEEVELWTRIYSLPAGSYTLSMDIKKSGNYYVRVYKLLNSSDGINNSTLIGSLVGGSDYQTQTLDFTVEEYHRNADDPSDAINQICGGYEDNLAYIHIDVYCANGGSLSIKNCSIIKNN